MKHILYEKVSFEEFANACKVEQTEKNMALMKRAYDKIPLPKRKTIGAAGYDFASPFTFTISLGNSILIPTGIRCKMDPGLFLMAFPRSGIGCNCGVCLANTAGLIDEDYYDNVKNEGHILLKLTYNGMRTLKYDYFCTQSDDVADDQLVLITNGLENPNPDPYLDIRQGDRIVEVIATTYYTQENEVVTGKREGGLGSTGK